MRNKSIQNTNKQIQKCKERMTDRQTDTSDDFKPSNPRPEKALVCIIQVWLLIVTRG